MPPPTFTCCARVAGAKPQDSSTRASVATSPSMHRAPICRPSSPIQAHKTHPLKLLATPTYASGRFDCDWCGQRGSGFSYHCAECSYDLHMVCASKPLRIHDQSHCHELHLTF
ncbi:hypothetical protein NL676_002197 [Syzygium grande]|nr:hypothetical protein NL676_002197 [Syzygium grande]